MRERLALLFPWLVLGVVLAGIVLDRTRSRDVTVVAADMAMPAGGVAPMVEGSALVARDPVCRMDVARGSSWVARWGDREFLFCTQACREEFTGDPGRWLEAPAPMDGSHVMRGLPTGLAQLGVALVLVLSFGLIELRTSRARMEELRLDLSAPSPVRRLLRWPPLVFVLRTVTVALFLLIVAAGLFGHQSPAMNVAPLLTWTIWWVGLVFLILYLGKAWCTVCPWDAIATWIERLRLWGPRRDGLGLQLRWPAGLRNIWFAVGLFVLLTWIELGAGITVIPRATAWVALGILGLAVASALIFERKAFCRYACLVGRVSGLYALFSSTELRATRTETCRSCRSLDCYHGNEHGDGCPTHQVVRTMDQSTYCTLCLECVRTCPHDNVSLRLRPWGADLLGTARPRRDEAFLSLILLAMTSFHGLTMTPRWADWNAALRGLTGLTELAGFSLLMLAALFAPIVLFWGLSALAARWSRSAGTWTVFLHYAYALLPIALFYHLAHNAEHLLIEGPKVLALISDPFGWGWNLFGTARWVMPPLISLEGLWGLQVLLVLVGHVYGLWISSRITRRLIPERRRAVLGQLPMLAAMVAFSVMSLWLLAQPMEMRVSAM